MQPTIDGQIDQIHLGRQPILGRDKKMVAFELLFRSNPHANAADFLSGSLATVTVINHAFNELGMQATLGSCLGFINVNEAILADEVIELLPKSKIVFEILETVKINEAVIARCRELKALGYRLALDDVACLNGDCLAIIDHIDVIKIDLNQIDQAKLDCMVSKIKAHNPDITLLAEKVETLEQFEHCLALGFNLFPGYFFARPQIISGRQISPSLLTILKLMEKIMNDAELDEIEKILKENAALSIKLLKIANSAAIGSTRTISSIREAVTILGRRQLQRWVQLLLYANNGHDKLSPLLLLASSRSRTMEMIARGKSESAFEDHAFITGIMSLADTLLGMPLDEIVDQIQLNEAVIDALLKREGQLGQLLRLVEHMEQDNENGIMESITHFPYLNPNGLREIHAESLLWANSLCQT